MISNVNLDSNSSKFEGLTYNFSNTAGNKSNSNSSSINGDDSSTSNKTVYILPKKNIDDKNIPSTINILPKNYRKN